MFLGRLLIGLILVVGVASNAFMLGGSQALRDAPIDVSRGEYEAALSRWEKLGVVEYEEVFMFDGCRYKAVVTVGDSRGVSNETIKSAEVAKVGNRGNVTCKTEHGEGFTVKDAFDFVDHVLSNPDEMARNAHSGSSHWYSTEFEAIIGYPRFILFNDGDGSDFGFRVEEVKILK